MPDRPSIQGLTQFRDEFCKKYIIGDEKGQAQIFLDHFFQAFGHAGALQAGAVFEERIAKGSKTGKTGFSDLVWKPRVLIEMKKRGTNLGLHYSQAFDYWTRAIPNRPRYVMLCNFDQFWVYDFNVQIDTPIDQVSIEELPDRVDVFGFMEIIPRDPVFGNNQVEVTELAARRLGEDLFPGLRDRIMREQKLDQSTANLMAQRLILQCVLAMFAEDRGLLPSGIFIRCLRTCLAGGNSYDEISTGLFMSMNQPGITPAGRFKGVDYFNGGLFSKIDPIELTEQELKILEVVALQNWSMIRPAIFGSIFESAIDAHERHARGIHYTSEADIMKVVRPTISQFWEEQIEAAESVEDLLALQLQLQSYRVLDPACGSGNFLYIAYQELKQIEHTLLAKLQEMGCELNEQMQMGFVTPMQFFGFDTNPFAVELARVTLMIARKVAIDRLQLKEAAIPLDHLDKNIKCQDALITIGKRKVILPTEWPQAHVIIGNPPFLGGYRMRRELGKQYLDQLAVVFPEVKDKVDFCIYWFRKAHDQILAGFADRVGLVGTNSISQGTSRIASLDYIVQNQGYIYNAVSTQPWSGQANVHISIVNWSTDKPSKYKLDEVEVSNITSSLKSSTDVSQAYSIGTNKSYAFKGVQPTGKAFIIKQNEALAWIQFDKLNAKVLKPFCDAKSLTETVDGQPYRWIIDFYGLSLEEASQFKIPFERVQTLVKPIRIQNQDERTRDYWWLAPRPRPEMRCTLEMLDLCLAIPRLSKWSIFLPAKTSWLPSDSTVVVASDDFYILGILTSSAHHAWIKAQSSTLKGDTRYTHNTCFETFPFPQTATLKQTQKIRDKMIELHQFRCQAMQTKGWGITKLYNEYFHEPASQLTKLHKQLDKLTLEAYHFDPKGDLLEQLLNLNQEIAQKEAHNEPVIGPWAIDQPPDRPSPQSPDPH